MQHPDFPYRLYLVTDEAACLGRDFFWVLEESLKGGVQLVQLREKSLGVQSFVEKALRTKEICEKYGVPLIINDAADVVRVIGAHGLHLGQQDLPVELAMQRLGSHLPIGLSLDRKENLTEPGADEAWYFGVSPIYPTPTKPDTYDAWGLEGLRWLRNHTAKPLVAIGNIKTSNAASVMAHGADCLAVVSGICSAESPAKAAESFLREIEKGINEL
ncbi:MAG: thiamine phosphate synthase [Lunatimonas sp.]|uniref:thiamine phosphate synthase n=1 Tax=Lunatimonas sp. TaxID=2060141 RepID=UPI00263BCA7D|nr:thiamine phosphate synthase [Lunatimonas sp.]MCC5937292.1 thiamine phosphate synthase [Lunatimonas sp.]